MTGKAVSGPRLAAHTPYCLSVCHRRLKETRLKGILHRCCRRPSQLPPPQLSIILSVLTREAVTRRSLLTHTHIHTHERSGNRNVTVMWIRIRKKLNWFLKRNSCGRYCSTHKKINATDWRLKGDLGMKNYFNVGFAEFIKSQRCLNRMWRKTKKSRKTKPCMSGMWGCRFITHQCTNF